MRLQRGFTLVEIGVVMTLLLALMTMMSMYFVRGQRYTAETEAYSSVQRAAGNLMRKMTDDVSRSSRRHIKIGTNDIIFLSFRPEAGASAELELDTTAGTNSGAIIWKKWVGYYLDTDKQTLYRGEEPLVPPLTNLDDSPTPATDVALFRTDPL